MHERPRIAADDPYVLPADPETRRLAISVLAFRAIAQKREAQLDDVLGPENTGLLSDMAANAANETNTQLMLTEHLLRQGWAWERILAAVWYNEDYLRSAALAE